MITLKSVEIVYLFIYFFMLVIVIVDFDWKFILESSKLLESLSWNLDLIMIIVDIFSCCGYLLM